MTDPPSNAASAPAPAAPRPARPGWVSVVAGALVGGLATYAVLRLGAPSLGDARPARDALRATFGAWLPLVLAPGVLLVAWLVIAVHEAGHVVGGLLARFRFQLLVVGPLRVEREGADGPVRVGLNRELSLYGGIAAAMPTDAERLGPRMAMLIAGGPLASVLLALGAWALVPSPAADAPTVGLLARLLASAVALMSAGIAVVTLVPLRTGGFATDGARLLRLARQGPDARREAATLTLLAQSGTGTPPRAWPPAMVEAARTPADGTLEELLGQLFAYMHLLELGHVVEAGAAIDRVMALRGTFPPAFAAGLDVEAAYHAAAQRGDVAGARALLAAVPARTPAVKPYDRARAEAAVLRAAGDAAGAARLAREALPTVPASAPFTRARLEELAAS